MWSVCFPPPPPLVGGDIGAEPRGLGFLSLAHRGDHTGRVVGSKGEARGRVDGGWGGEHVARVAEGLDVVDG